MPRLIVWTLLALPLAAQFRGGMKPVENADKPIAVRNNVAQPADEIVTLRYFRIKKGTFDQFLKASVEGVWPFFEKIGSRTLGMWKVIEPENVEGLQRTNKDYDEVYMITRYATVEHWKATRDATKLGGNGPDWQKCKEALDFRQTLTISSSVQFMKGSMAPGGPFFMPGIQ